MAAESDELRGVSPRTPARRYLRRATLSLLALVLLIGAGCSVRKLAYGWGSRLLVSRFTDTFDLNANQKRDLVARVGVLHDWHRKNELLKYVEFIDQIMARAQDGLDRNDVEWMLEASYPHMERLSARFSPEAAAIMATLSDAQIDHAVAEFKKAEKERFEKLEQSEDEYIRHRMKSAKKNMKTWLGSYTDAQMQEYERYARKNRLEETRRRKRYQENAQTLLKALRSHPPQAQIAELLHRWLTRQEVEPTSEFQAAEKRVQADFVDIVVTVDRMMSPEQRKHLLNELKGWRTDFYELAHGI